MPGIPILRLPYYVYEDVLKLMDIEEHIHLAATSKRCLASVKQFLAQKPPMEFTLTRFSSRITRLESNALQRSVRIFGSSVENEVKTIIPACLTLFKITKCTLNVRQETFMESKKYLEVLKGTYTVVTFREGCYTRSREKTNPEHVIDVFRQVQEVSLTWSHRGGLFPKSTIRPFQFEKLMISSASWVNIQHLTNLFINCKYVNLSKKCVLTNSEFRTFLKRWMKGSEMRGFRIHYSRFNMKIIVQGLEATPFIGVIQIENKEYMMQEGDCYTIEQENGQRAVVFHEYVNRELFDFRMNTDFTILQGRVYRYRLYRNGSNRMMIPLP
ncbi:hypothetical protein B9Z55_000227 [Caenorhabditis nigoni]|uniref:Sdz-33 F-box domain-containing protein n=1 Tax=Caenorhabditis nigoni TaxID=1611254 RepID=A0A2G5VJP7_9PELO|nr:hypothetical protein B9Z55_000227 [Caenorhabditis nigoni]